MENSKRLIFIYFLLGADASVWSNEIRTVDQLTAARETMIKNEFSRSTGNKIVLSDKEENVNEIIMKLKKEEIRAGFLHPETWPTSSPLTQILEIARKSKLFSIIQSMPKGGILHGHDSAIGSTETFIKLTHIPNAWICFIDAETVTFTFSKDSPIDDKCDAEWQLLETLRKKGLLSDVCLVSKFSLQEEFKSTKEAWNRFHKMFKNTGGLLKYKPSFKEYVKSYLKECLDDGVQYLELRSSVKGVSFFF